jgi:hypothetical protein
MAMLACPGSEWVLRLGPLTRTNAAGSREQSEEGARQQVLDDGQELMGKAAAMFPLLSKGAVCSSGCGGPELLEEAPEATVHSFQLPDGKWFSLATSNVFGAKLVCKRG